jgi:protease-4
MSKDQYLGRVVTLTLVLLLGCLGQTGSSIVLAADAVAKPRFVGWLELSGPLREGPPPVVIISADEAGPSLRSTVKRLHDLAQRDEYDGLVIYLAQPQLSLTQVGELGQAILVVRAAGKKVLAFAEAYDLPSYLLACYTDEILLQHHGELRIQGIRVEEIYLRGLFEKLGIKADMLQVGRFKGAADPLTRTGPSEAWSQNIDALLDDLYDQMLLQIEKARHLKRAQVEALFADCLALTDEQFVQRGAIDRLVNRDLAKATAEHFGDDFARVHMDAEASVKLEMNNPLALFSTLFQPRKPRIQRDTIALVHAGGVIARGDANSRGAATGLFGSTGISSRAMVRTFGKIAKNAKIKGVVLRIDSPGGSALASEMIWQAAHELAQGKPVYVSVGPMAASGGYYIACAAQRIYVSEQSIVGSIGVVGGKITLGGLYEKIGLNVHSRARGPLSSIFNSSEPFTDQQRKVLQASMQRTYDLFTQRIMAGRSTAIKDIDAVAHGRVFTGRQAVKNGMADRLGSVEDAITDLADHLGLIKGSYDVVAMPPPLTLAEFLDQFLGGTQLRAGLEAINGEPALQLARGLLGAQRWRAAARTLTGLMLIRDESVLTLMPRAIVVR